MSKIIVIYKLKIINFIDKLNKLIFILKYYLKIFFIVIKKIEKM